MVHHHGTVTAAPDALHLMLSAVSHQLRQLSRQMGTPLTVSHGRGLRPTLWGHARRGMPTRSAIEWKRAQPTAAQLNSGPATAVGNPQSRSDPTSVSPWARTSARARSHWIASASACLTRA